jgi:hypothetical protein
MKSRTSCWRAVSSAIDVQPNTTPVRKGWQLKAFKNELIGWLHSDTPTRRYADTFPLTPIRFLQTLFVASSVS